MLQNLPDEKELVNCRIGSLESFNSLVRKEVLVNCRIGSLETYFVGKDVADIC